MVHFHLHLYLHSTAIRTSTIFEHLHKITKKYSECLKIMNSYQLNKRRGKYSSSPNICIGTTTCPTSIINAIRKASYNCTSLLRRRTSSPGLKAGIPIYGQPSQRNASPRLQFPHDPTLPWTVKSTSARSSAPSLRVWS